MKITYSELDYEYRKKLEKFFGIGNYLIEVNPGKLIVPRIFQELCERMLSLEVRPDDVWLVSYLRTGSNWTREILWCLINDLDYEGAKLRIERRAPLLELTGLVGGDYNRELAYTKNHLFNNSVDRVEHMSSPRLIKTHLPWQLIPTRINITKSKIIYIARNPKDCCVSFYYYSLQFYNAQGTFEDFCKLFLLGKMFYGNMWEHARHFWKHRHESNILFLKYEDMKKNHLGCVKMISDFLGKNYSDEELRGLVEHTSFSKMRQNPALNREDFVDEIYKSGEGRTDVKFIRKGHVGDWQNHMSKEIADQFDEMSQKWWSDIGLTFEDRI